MPFTPIVVRAGIIAWQAEIWIHLNQISRLLTPFTRFLSDIFDHLYALNLATVIIALVSETLMPVSLVLIACLQSNVMWILQYHLCTILNQLMHNFGSPTNAKWDSSTLWLILVYFPPKWTFRKIKNITLLYSSRRHCPEQHRMNL